MEETSGEAEAVHGSCFSELGRLDVHDANYKTAVHASKYPSFELLLSLSLPPSHSSSSARKTTTTRVEVDKIPSQLSFFFFPIPLQEEASQFAANIKLIEKDIRGLKLADETFMNTCKQVLGSDLPRVSPE